MFVEYRAPARVTQPYPIVLVHGTAQTGINFLGTPDGRPGWADRFAAKGFTVYIVDQVGRGRSGGDPETYGPYARLPVEDLETVFTGQERVPLYPQAKLHSQWPGGPGVRGNAAFDQFYLSQVPYIASALKSEELVDPALIALLEKIGPAILLTHSQAGVFGWAVSDQRPDLVKAHVAVEPNGPTFFDIRFKGGADWYERVGEARARPYGITRVPLHFERQQPGRFDGRSGRPRRRTRQDPLLASGRARSHAAEPRPRARRTRHRRSLVPRHHG